MLAKALLLDTDGVLGDETPFVDLVEKDPFDGPPHVLGWARFFYNPDLVKGQGYDPRSDPMFYAAVTGVEFPVEKVILTYRGFCLSYVSGAEKPGFDSKPLPFEKGSSEAQEFLSKLDQF